MADRHDSDAIYNLAAHDPSVWLGQAQSLKLAAQLHWDEMTKVWASDSMPKSSRDDLLLAYMNAYMLLTGFAFENLIKGVIISRASGDHEKSYQEYWKRVNGHNLTNLIALTGITLDTPETELLQRLQTFTFWAGRYFLPSTSNDFYREQELVHINGLDKIIVENLFTKLTNCCR